MKTAADYNYTDNIWSHSEQSGEDVVKDFMDHLYPIRCINEFNVGYMTAHSHLMDNGRKFWVLMFRYESPIHGMMDINFYTGSDGILWQSCISGNTIRVYDEGVIYRVIQRISEVDKEKILTACLAVNEFYYRELLSKYGR